MNGLSSTASFFVNYVDIVFLLCLNILLIGNTVSFLMGGHRFFYIKYGRTCSSDKNDKSPQNLNLVRSQELRYGVRNSTYMRFDVHADCDGDTFLK